MTPTDSPGPGFVGPVLVTPGPASPVPQESAVPAVEWELGDQPYRLAPDHIGLGTADRHRGPRRLTVVYDEHCALCRRAREWLSLQQTYIPLELLAAGSAEAIERYGSLPWLGEELVVVDEHGQAWIGPAAFLVAMWATTRYRHWSYRLSGPAFAPLAEQFFHRISTRRKRLGAILGSPECTYCARPGVRS